MTITESRLKSGSLTLGSNGSTTTFACQATNVHLTPTYDDDGDPLETLCGDSIPAGKKESWVLGGTSVQDFDDPQGFLSYCWDNRMTTVPFTWEPNTVGAPTYSGELVVVALEEGGDVNVRLTTDWEFDVSGELSRTYAGGGSVAATGADAGTPGAFTPSGCTVPADLAAVQAAAIVANPATAWTTGQNVVTADAAPISWDGTAWVAGAVP